MKQWQYIILRVKNISLLTESIDFNQLVIEQKVQHEVNKSSLQFESRSFKIQFKKYNSSVRGGGERSGVGRSRGNYSGCKCFVGWLNQFYLQFEMPPTSSQMQVGYSLDIFVCWELPGHQNMDNAHINTRNTYSYTPNTLTKMPTPLQQLL